MWENLNDLESKMGDAVASAKHYWTDVSSVTGDRDLLAAECEALALEMQRTPGLAK